MSSYPLCTQTERAKLVIMLHDITQYALDSQTCRYSNQLYGSVKSSYLCSLASVTADEVLFLVACACNFVC